MSKLIEQTNAYKIVSGDLKRGTLSHAYLIVCADRDKAEEYAKSFAKAIQCENGTGCGECRACRLIEKNVYSDCTLYPESGDKILAGDVDDLLSRIAYKPIENKTRVFLLAHAESMTAAAQNKLLKTLEEPPANVCIVLVAASDYTILPTVKSRVKRLDIPPFGDKALFDGLKDRMPDYEKLRRAIALSGGAEGKVEAYYAGDNADKNVALCKRILSEMTRSSDVVKYVGLIDQNDMKGFVAAMRTEVFALLRSVSQRSVDVTANGFTAGALLGINDRLGDAEKALNFNSNAMMTADGILFGILEEKHRWQKS